MIVDHNIAWVRKRLWLTPEMIQGIDSTAQQAYETAGVTPVQVTNVGMGTWIMTDGEFLNGYIPVPFDLDPIHPVGFRICYTLDHDGAGDAWALWKLLYALVKEGVAIAIPAVALDTVFVQDNYKDSTGALSVTDFLLQWTARGIINSLKLTRAEIENGTFLTLKLEMDTADQETSVHLIGLEMDYVPLKMVGQGSPVAAPLSSIG